MFGLQQPLTHHEHAHNYHTRFKSFGGFWDLDGLNAFMPDKLAYENRRAEFRKRPPTHYCGRCTSVLYEEDVACLECGARPDHGWQKLGPLVDPWLGKTIDGRYLLTRGIGAGASGFVYRAESLAISRQFAIKIVPLESEDATANSETIRARLNREIGALGQLRNPHIVSFYDVLPIGDSAVALLMDLIEGRTLQGVVWAAGSLELGRALKILRQIANGVHEAHEANMIHRDLKPDNIMIERLPAGDDFVHILDFGIVHRLDDVRVTQGFLGTPLYASPEQAVGGSIDRRADIYALGAVTFFMLTGKPPFDDDSVYTVLKAHVSTKPARLSEALPGGHFPDEIEDLVAKMLAKNPDDRPQSLAAVIEALDHFAQQRPDVEHARAQGDSAASGSLRPIADAACGPEPNTGLNMTVASSASLDEASSGRPGRRASAPKSAVFQRRRSDVALRPLSEHNAPGACAGTQLGLAPSRAGERRASIVSDADIFALPERWYGRGTSLQGMAPGNLRADFQRQYWSILDGARRLVVGKNDSPEVLYFQTPELPAITAMVQCEWTVLTGHADGAVFRWNAENPTGELLHQNASHAAVSAMVCNESYVLFGTVGGGLFAAVFNDEPIQPLRIQSGAAVRVLAARRGRTSFAVARASGFIDVYSTAAPHISTQRISPPRGVTELAFSQDGYLLAASFEDQKVLLYNALTGAEIARSGPLSYAPQFIRFDSAGRLVAECEVDGEIVGLELQRHLFSPAPMG